MNSTSASTLAFGIKVDLTIAELGTKGDLITFFAVIIRLIENGHLGDQYRTITRDLYCSCIHHHNIEDFSEQVKELTECIKDIAVNSVAWDDLPYHRGVFREGIQPYDLNRNSVYSVLEKYFRLFFEYIEFYPVARKEGYKVLPMYVTPTDIQLCRKYRKMTVEDFEAQSADPLWLREPLIEQQNDKVFTHFIDARKRPN